MFRNILAATLRNLERNGLYAAISIVGLAIAMAAALLTGLYIRDELTFDRFIEGHSEVQVLAGVLNIPERPSIPASYTPAWSAAWLKQDYPQIKVTRLIPSGDAAIRRGEVEASEDITWADPNFFQVMPMPVLAGDPTAALSRPDGVVITRALARKYFGRDTPIGETLQLSRTNTFKVGAVLQDLPGNSHIKSGFFPSALNAASPMKVFDAQPFPRGNFTVSGWTYMRFPSPEAAARAKADMKAFSIRHMALPDGTFRGGISAELFLVPLDKLHLYPFRGAAFEGEVGSVRALTSLGLIAGLILLSAGINFVNLTTARATRRMIEVGVRKAAGAERSHLIVQFLGEAVVHALFALLLAVVMVELLLPGARALLDRPLSFGYWRDPAILATVLGMALGIGVLAGVYPAFVQSSFRPAQALKAGLPVSVGSTIAREALVVVQFAILIGLILGTIVISRQTHFALNDALGLNTEQMVMMNIDVDRPPGAPPQPLCRDAFVEQVTALPGVAGAACASSLAFDLGQAEGSVMTRDGREAGFGLAFVDHGFFELYGLKPVAGRFFSRAHPADEVPLGPGIFTPKAAVINESAARALGFAAPEAAVGQTYRAQFGPEWATPQIVGVVPDFAFNQVGKPVRPMAYYDLTLSLSMLSIKLKPGTIPQTLEAIDAAWKRTGIPRPADRRFVDEHVEEIYKSTIRQGWLIDALAGIAVVIAALGLFGLAAFAAERRTKEIGVRKAMGASTGDIFRLLLWQFTRPVLIANLIAWPAGYFLLQKWLEEFPRRIDMPWWTYLAASGLAVLIAWLTVSGHTLLVARAKPVEALRYE